MEPCSSSATGWSTGADRVLFGGARRVCQRALLLALVLGPCGPTACSWFPNSGPTAEELVDSVKADTAHGGVRIVELTPTVLQVLRQDETRPSETIPEPSSMPWSDMIGVGDTLSVMILEAGPGLFSRPTTPGAPPGPTFTLLVDAEGGILVPYAGHVLVSGRTPREVSLLIERALAGKADQPQVVVSVAKDLSNTVVITGDVKLPGRYPLGPRGENLLDLITIAGGPSNLIPETTVRFARESRVSEFPLEKVGPFTPENVALAPNDHIILIGRPRSFLVFGASGRVADVPFNALKVTLAQAVARASGPADVQADPTGVYLFRFEDLRVTRALGLPPQDNLPVIYHLNLLEAGAYFDMSAFDVHDKDLIYVANARINVIQKFMGLVQTLFTPVLVGRTVAQ